MIVSILEAKIDYLTDIFMAQHAGENIHIVGGYVQGRTTKGAGFLLLYPSRSYFSIKVCRVYQEQFPRVPTFIDIDIPQQATEENLTREKAEKLGVFKPCRDFTVVTYMANTGRNQKETRFSRVIPSPSDRVNGLEFHSPPTIYQQVMESNKNFLPVAATLDPRYRNPKEVIGDLKALGYEGIPGGPESAKVRALMIHKLAIIADAAELGADPVDAWRKAAEAMSFED